MRTVGQTPQRHTGHPGRGPLPPGFSGGSVPLLGGCKAGGQPGVLVPREAPALRASVSAARVPAGPVWPSAGVHQPVSRTAPAPELRPRGSWWRPGRAPARPAQGLWVPSPPLLCPCPSRPDSQPPPCPEQGGRGTQAAWTLPTPHPVGSRRAWKGLGGRRGDHTAVTSQGPRGCRRGCRAPGLAQVSGSESKRLRPST